MADHLEKPAPDKRLRMFSEDFAGFENIDFSAFTPDKEQSFPEESKQQELEKQSYTFSCCSATGPKGPSKSDVEFEYLNSSLANKVSVTDGIQEWATPHTGTYTITAYGAGGGSASNTKKAGKGAKITGDFEFIEGQILRILVGQCGTHGGGGGGSFVVLGDTQEALVVAGGGGGVAYSSKHHGLGGRADEFGGKGIMAGEKKPKKTESDEKSDISPGLGGLQSDYAGGGSGFEGNSKGEGYVDEAQSFLNGGGGGRPLDVGAVGGFGGGGAEGSGFVPFSTNAAGGGGYTGGNGNSQLGGGGGSFNSGKNQTNERSHHKGMGKVVILCGS